MSLQASAFLSSALSAHKEGRVSAAYEDSGFFGVSLSDHVKADFSAASLRTQKVRVVRAQTVTAAPSATRSTSDGKRTLRQGSVIEQKMRTGEKFVENT